MIKKAVFAAGGLALLALLFCGRDAVSYVTTSVSKVHQSVKESVPVSFEIERARKMVSNLEPEIRRNMHLIAKEEVSVERLERQIAQQESGLATDKSELLQLKNDLASGDGEFRYKGIRFTAAQVREDLSNRFQRYRTCDVTLTNLKKVLHARHRSLAAAQQKLDGMLAAKRQLEVEIENLEARLKMVEVAQTSSELNLDNSHLARTRDLINDIQARIEVDEKLVNAEIYFHDEIPLGEPESDDVTAEIARYFADPSPELETVAVDGTN